MLIPASQLKSASVRARDGEVGTVHDLLFDDRFWHVRYFVVATGSWLAGRQVLVSPLAITASDEKTHCLTVNLTQDEVRHSPVVDASAGLSRAQEHALHDHYRWPPYWGAEMTLSGDVMPDPVGQTPLPQLLASPTPADSSPGNANPAPARDATNSDDAHVRSTEVVRGHTIAATDGEIGHVEDFLIDPKSWQIRYVVVDTRTWWPGGKVVLAPLWLNRVSWTEAKVFVDLTRSAIKAAPAYDSSRPVFREYADQLHRHYQRPPHQW